MILFPRESFVLQTLLPRDLARKTLAWHVQQEQDVEGSARQRAFRGRIGEEDFVIRRERTGRNSFAPRIRGRLEAASHGTKIHVRMGLFPVAAGVMAVVLGIPASLFVWAGRSLLRPGTPPGRGLWIALGVSGVMMVIGVAMALVGFQIASRHDRRMLQSIFQEHACPGENGQPGPDDPAASESRETSRPAGP